MHPPFSSAPVLDFRPGAAVPPGVSDRWRLSLLWPAWAYRVLAPVTRERTVNLFERTTLALCRAGASEATEIAALLGFDVELAARVLHDLERKDLTDELGVPTAKGRDTLSELDTPSEEDYEAGYVFRDPQSGSLFPRIVPADDYHRALTDSQVDDQGIIRIRRGAVGHGKLFRPFAVYPDSSAPPLSLSPDEVLDASRLHGRALKSHRKKQEQRQSTTEEGTTVAVAPDEVVTLSDAEREQRQMDVKKVALIDDAPQPVWLYTVAHHTAAAPAHPDAWTACDPFGLGDSPSLLRRLRERAATLPPLQERIAERTGEARQQRQNDARDLDELRRELAAQAVAERLGTEVPETVMTHLRLMETYLDMGETGSPFHLRGAVTEAQSAAEALFQILLRGTNAYRVHKTNKALSREGRIAFVNDIAAEAGFKTPLPEGVSVQSLPLEKCRGHRGSLRAYVSAALYDAHFSQGHPLRRAAVSDPTLIDRLDMVAAIRNEKGGHAGSPPTLAEATAAAHDVYQACEVILPLL